MNPGWSRRWKRAGRLLLLLGTLCLGRALAAGTQGLETAPALQVFGFREGLPALTIYAITQDPAGRFWLGTQSGAAMFTGQRWETVRFPGKIPPSVVRSILAGKDGAIWFASDNIGLWKLHKDVWTHFGPEQGLPSYRVNTIWEGSLGGGPAQLILGTVRGLVKLEGNSFVPFNPVQQGLGDSWIWKLRQAPDGALWVAARGWIGCYAKGRWEVFTKEQGLPAPDANDMEWLPRPGGGWDLLVAIWNKGVFRFDGARWSPFLQGSLAPSLYPIAIQRTPDPEGGEEILWIGT